jgi:hypothetical protein
MKGAVIIEFPLERRRAAASAEAADGGPPPERAGPAPLAEVIDLAAHRREEGEPLPDTAA